MPYFVQRKRNCGWGIWSQNVTSLPLPLPLPLLSLQPLRSHSLTIFSTTKTMNCLSPSKSMWATTWRSYPWLWGTYDVPPLNIAAKLNGIGTIGNVSQAQQWIFVPSVWSNDRLKYLKPWPKTSLPFTRLVSPGDPTRSTVWPVLLCNLVRIIWSGWLLTTGTDPTDKGRGTSFCTIPDGQLGPLMS